VVVTKSVGSLEQLLMFATLRLGVGAHGLAIRREVERLAGRTVSHGALYTTMDRLEGHGLVESWIGTQTPEGGGRQRKFYRLTPTGARALRDGYVGLQRVAADTLEELAALAADA
jgi:PadR family transcriptional regulator PadR